MGRRLAFDIETDGLLDELTCIHSIAMVDIDTGEGWSCTDHPGYVSPLGHTVLTIEEGLRLLQEADEIIGHNIIKFDIPAIIKVYPWWFISRQKVTDTLILSRLIWPEIRDNDFALRKQHMPRVRNAVRIAKREDPEVDEFALQKELMNKVLPGYLIGSHGLEAWGYRLGEWKGDYSKEMKSQGLDPWAHWNTEMQEYCEQDIVVTRKLYALQISKDYSAFAIQIERDFAWVMAEMERNGFPFDLNKATRLQQELMRKQAILYNQLQDAFPPITDTWTFVPKANNSKFGYVKGKPIQKSKEIVFNPGSRDHIARWLKQKYGWVPTEFTEGSETREAKPKIDEKVLKKLPYPEASLLAEYFLLDKRLGMLEGRGGKGLIPAAKKGGGTIHGSINTNGAVTRRCTHASPNMAQIPAVTVVYGREFRELLHAPEGWSLLGWDASGLELRCFAHYMARYDDGAYTRTVLEGDIHWVHANALSGGKFDGVEYDDHNEEHAFWRNKVAKRFIYAFLYGAGAETIGEIMDPTGSSEAKAKAGRKLINTFLKRTPALKRLKEDLKVAVKKRKMHVMGIDRGILKVRSDHSALNTLLQSAGAIAVKLATIIYYDKLIAMGLKNGVDFMLVAHVHDEAQTLVKKGLEQVVGQAAVEAMREAGEALGFECPLDGEFKFGANWAETH